MPLPQLVIIGIEGYLGSHLFRSPALNAAFEITGTARNSEIRIDLSDRHSFADVQNFLCLKKPRYLVIAAAVSDVEKCAINPEKTRKINIEGTQALLEIARTHNVTPIFFSSDYVLRSTSQLPVSRNEDYPTEPTTEYGRQKLTVETWIAENFAQHVIFRTSKLMGLTLHSRNILTQTTEALRRHETIKAFTDQWITPIFIEDIAAVIAHSKFSGLSGTYHLATETVFTRYELACRLRNQIESDSRIEKNTLNDMKTLETRPHDCTLDSKKIQAALGFRFREIAFENLKPHLERS